MPHRRGKAVSGGHRRLQPAALRSAPACHLCRVHPHPSQHPPEAMTSSARRARGLLGDRASSILRPHLLLRPAPAGPAPSGPVAVVCTERVPLLACCAAARPRRRLSSEMATGRRTCEGEGAESNWSTRTGASASGGKAPGVQCWGGCGLAGAVRHGCRSGRAGRPAARRRAMPAPLRTVPPAWCSDGWAAALAATAGGRAAWWRGLRPVAGPGGAGGDAVGGQCSTRA